MWEPDCVCVCGGGCIRAGMHVFVRAWVRWFVCGVFERESRKCACMCLSRVPMLNHVKTESRRTSRDRRLKIINQYNPEKGLASIMVIHFCSARQDVSINRDIRVTIVLE